MARIDVYKNGLLVPTSREWWTKRNSVTDLGFSDSALIATIVFGCVVVVVCLAVAGFCTYPKGIPVGGTNSAVISAACHVQYKDGREVEVSDDIVERPLKWGVTVQGTQDEVGHCCFSDKEVQKPVEGCLYA